LSHEWALAIVETGYPERSLLESVGIHGSSTMMAGSLYTIIVVAQVAVGGLWHHDRGPGYCDVCGVETARIQEEIATLQACPKWRVRDDAAHALRRFDWKCHPEIVAALATALLRDCEEEARRALERLDRRCLGDCRICGPAVGQVSIPVPVQEPILVPGSLPEPPSYQFPAESPPVENLPPPLPGPSPFVLPPSATRPRIPALADGHRPAPAPRRPASVLFLIGRRPQPDGGR
jgi:hypothetical protein